MMQDTAPSIAKQLSYEGFPKRKSKARSAIDSRAGRIFESAEVTKSVNQQTNKIYF